MLPLESQVHWWRHYYTVDVKFDQSQRQIDIWFDFPPGRGPELSRIVPELQVPEVRAEFRRHEQVFAANGLNWFLRSRIYETPYQTAEDLPEPVLREMLLTIAARRQLEAEERRRALVEVYEEARPQLERRLEEIRQGEAESEPNVIAVLLHDLAIDMKRLGAPASARTLLREAFRKAANAGLDTRLSIGLALIQLLIESKDFVEAVRRCHELVGAVSALPAGDPRSDKFWNLKIEAEIRAGYFEDGLESVKQRRLRTNSVNDVDRTRTAEVRFLQAELLADESNDD